MPRGVNMGRPLSIGLHGGPRWGRILALAVAALLAVWFIEQNAVRYASYTQAAYGDYFVSNLLVGWHVAPADDVDTIMAWACWSVPLLVAEPLLQQRRLRRR
jgi:hypothetical protein